MNLQLARELYSFARSDRYNYEIEIKLYVPEIQLDTGEKVQFLE